MKYKKCVWGQATLLSTVAIVLIAVIYNVMCLIGDNESSAYEAMMTEY